MNRIIYVIALTILISACSSKPKGPVHTPPSSVEAISSWETSGRVGIRTADDAVSGNFNWQKTPNTFSLKVVGPFGQGATTLTQNNNSLVTLSYDGKQVTGSSPAELLEQELGWGFPVEDVDYWIRGLISPHSNAEVKTDSATLRPQQITQNGWLITYTNFTEVDGLYLPQKMQVQNPPYRINLIINQWTVR
ncbi:lipoprotein insertase outer membrane protein LolB [Marinomonas sp. C2222]|uniref:Outer-membrane lipoprotein LolB n=1 Tax=Marinomonas sargassi TaxID=2984494 RepID=A0ABT2YUZ8_9GAMM|nr:lipoprotein insertase outer membrane protein LolB [Marinomonas sargassi]MCV2403720.1 lipoprotein insertase outer membrane protein LolB [Marinomonas sargassi]